MSDLLGNLGDFIGGIGVVITLIYLATQIRHNSRVVQTSNFVNAMEQNLVIWNAVVESDEMADIYRRGVERFDSLSPNEQVRFHMLMSQYITMLQTTFQLRERGVIDASLSAEFSTNGLRVFELPGVRGWWDANRMWFHESFRNWMDGELGEQA